MIPQLGASVHCEDHGHGIIVDFVDEDGECSPEEACFIIVQWDKGTFSPIPIINVEPMTEH